MADGRDGDLPLEIGLDVQLIGDDRPGRGNAIARGATKTRPIGAGRLATLAACKKEQERKQKCIFILDLRHETPL